MKNKEIKSYIEQAMRKLPLDKDVGGVKYYLKKAITLLGQPEIKKEINKDYALTMVITLFLLLNYGHTFYDILCRL